jgi:hypothetical protein
LLNYPRTVMFTQMSEKIHIVIAIPFGYADRDRLVQFIESKFPEAEISVVHEEVSKPRVAETLVEHDASAPPAETAEEIAFQDSRSVMQKVADALSGFTRSGGS